ncbi:MAG: hypothetical protein AB1467_05210 [Candidatus Diapherotrites archaeon]
MKYYAKDFIRSELKKELGIRSTEIRRLGALIGRLNKKMSLEEAAKDAKIPLEEAKELLAAYSSYKNRIPLDSLKKL